MKKIAVFVLSLLVLGKIFACESIFDKIDGITCEIQYILCKGSDIDIKGSDIDIKVCDKVLEKVEQYEQYEQALEKYRDASKTAAKLKREIEKENNVREREKMRLEYLDLVYDAGIAFNEYNNALNVF